MKRRKTNVPFVSLPLRVPLILQQEVVECGAACLSMVLGYFGKWIPLSQTRSACNVGRDGVSAAAILKAARSYGLTAKGMRVEPENLGDLLFPLIAYLDFRHFVVVVRGTRRGVVINDPGFGRRVMTWKEFDLAFTGVALEFSPGPDFRPSGQPPSFRDEATRFLKPAGGSLVLAALAGVAGALVLIATPLVTRGYFDTLFGSLATKKLPFEALKWLVLMLALSLGLALWARDRALVMSAIGRSCNESRKLLGRIMELPSSFFRLRHRGVIAASILSIEELVGSLVMSVGVLCGELLLLIGALVSCFLINSVVGTILLVLVALWACLSVLLGWWGAPSANRRAIGMSAQAGVAATTFHDLERIRANGDESEMFSNWTGASAARSRDTAQSQTILLTYQALPIGFVGLGYLLVTWMAGIGVLKGTIRVGEMFQLQLLLTFAILAAQDCLSSLGSLLGLSPSLDFERDVSESASHERSEIGSHQSAREGLRSGSLSGALEVVGVGLKVDQAAWVLREISFSMSPGEHVAIVGRSGAGKSSLAQVLAGLVEPTEGTVFFDGFARGTCPVSTVAKSVAYIEQFGSLVRGTVRDNLALWDPTIPDAELLVSARDARILADILAKPGGLDRKVDVDSPEWSGGQRQRIAIARALVRKPSILILDEATSALDSVTEASIYETIRARGCSVVIVAHRLSTVRHADRIIVLDGGVVVEQGNHDELIASGGFYAGLVNDAV